MKLTGNAVSTFLVRKGEHVTVSASGDLVTVGKGEPDLYGQVVRLGGYQAWKVTVGKTGQVIDYGASRWRWRAVLKARAVGQRRDIAAILRGDR